MNNLRSHCSQRESGYTLTDLLVVLSGAVPAFWLSRYFPGAWRTPMYYVLAVICGLGFWCVLFLWLLPLIRRRRQARRDIENE